MREARAARYVTRYNEDDIFYEILLILQFYMRRTMLRANRLLVAFNIPRALTLRRQFYEAVSGANKLSK